MMSESAVLLQSVTKRFEATVAVRNVSMSVQQGEVLALLGENGAGKSTLVKMIAGLVTPDRGDITVDGETHRRLTPALAAAHKIGLVQQELSQCPNLTVAENMFLGRPTPRRLGMIDHGAMNTAAAELLSAVGVRVPLYWRMNQLSLSEAQLVELAKQLLREPRVLILDEATSALSADESDVVYAQANALAQRGTAVVLITHRLSEIHHATRAIVMRDGEIAGELKGADIRPEKAIPLMLGRELTATFPPRTASPKTGAAARIAVDDLELGGPKPMSFACGPGEIIGVGGLAGQGQRDLMRWLFGLERRPGHLRLDGRPVHLHSAVDAMRHGVCYVPEERKLEALLIDLSVTTNLSLPASLDTLTRYGVVRFQPRAEAVRQAVKRFGILAPDVGVPARQLSGGNQQKVALARWWTREPRVYVLEDPTRGIDVGSKHEIYQLLHTLAGSGATILLTSSDTLELANICHRVLVMYERSIVAEFGGDALTEAELVSASVRGHVS